MRESRYTAALRQDPNSTAVLNNLARTPLLQLDQGREALPQRATPPRWRLNRPKCSTLLAVCC